VRCGGQTGVRAFRVGGRSVAAIFAGARRAVAAIFAGAGRAVAGGVGRGGGSLRSTLNSCRDVHPTQPIYTEVHDVIILVLRDFC
jgi:hypothetical protein